MIGTSCLILQQASSLIGNAAHLVGIAAQSSGMGNGGILT